MHKINGLSNRNSFLIGFVKTCLCFGAVNIKEAHEWVYYTIEQYDDLPPYMYYLMDTKDYRRFCECIGFSPNSQLSSKEEDALIALAHYRDPSQEWSSNIPKGFAIGALKRNPQVIDRFKETFPFIDLPDTLNCPDNKT